MTTGDHSAVEVRLIHSAVTKSALVTDRFLAGSSWMDLLRSSGVRITIGRFVLLGTLV
jgi:hypothetical protein